MSDDPRDLPEIIVTGKRDKPTRDWGFWDFYNPGGTQEDFAAGGDVSGGGGPVSAGMPAPVLPFIPPPSTLPPPPGPPPSNVIPFPEIKVIAKRPPPFAMRPPPLPGWLVGGNVAALLANIGVIWSDYRSMRMLDDAAAGLLMPYTGKPDTPVQTKPAETIPEIIVTASRADSLRAALGAYVLPPPPMFWPDQFTEASPGRAPLEIAPPVDVPIEISPPARPTAPRRPRRKSQPTRRQKLRPSKLPVEIPVQNPGFQIAAQPGSRVVTQPSTNVNRLTGSNPTVLGLPGLTTVSQTQPQPQPQQQRRCRPCKKPKEKKRKKCYKQLVQQRKYKRWDKVSKWQEIDCLTGRPK